MKTIKYLLSIYLIAVLGISMTSCEDYLEKTPASDISDKDAFGNFTSFQGFIELLYNCIVDPDKGGAWNNHLFADENVGPSPYPFDQGNYWSNSGYLFGSLNPTSTNSRDKRLWENAWWAIREANLALEKLEEEGLFNGTDEERNLIKGQALFLRGWFYFDICRYWGGMPYVDKVIGPADDMFTEEFNRLNFRETALRMVEDFRAAANLLPDHWDKCGPGQTTLGNNSDRINKFHCLAYMGKAYLFAASPMINEEATGNNSFDPELCAKAAQAFGELLTLRDNTNIYSLQTWDTWTDIFWRYSYLRPGGTECIMVPIIFDRGRVRWSTTAAMVPSSLGLNSGSSADVATHNFVKNYAMANGLPIDDPESGYNDQDPWTNREPRFYKDILYDGCQIWQAADINQYAQLYNGGYHRNTINPASASGYYYKRYAPMGPGFSASMANQLQAYIPYMRLSDVYLMYAEAVNFMTGGGPTAKASNYSMTAVDALNMIRTRGQIPELTPKYYANKDVFFEEIVRERAVEMAFEGQRFDDLRRWNRNYDPRYIYKTAVDFDRGPDGKPENVRERVILTRAVDKKHNWLPIMTKYTTQFAGFPQNPGW
ncbi:MAG: RagB/SusD family nutrient uptake outer membrane protein [Tannerella sp.]|nr:RagB/SusD family nutrient uptake outer membrane protein [Tannerella sp.]